MRRFERLGARFDAMLGDGATVSSSFKILAPSRKPSTGGRRSRSPQRAKGPELFAHQGLRGLG
ncbi:MAG: hypothetical protein Q4A73_06835 [Campylobacter sp.]|nr:hypothetical protein [Campylobacter sp.]